MHENEITAKLVTALRQHCKAMVLKLHGHTMQEPGWPDFYIAHPKFHGWIEAKGPNTVVRPLQRNILRKLRANEANVFILTYVEDKLFSIEDCEDYILAEFRFSKWQEAAELFLHHLGELCGFRNNERMSPNIQR